MALNEALLPEFDHEMAKTRITLERVPDDKPRLETSREVVGDDGTGDACRKYPKLDGNHTRGGFL